MSSLRTGLVSAAFAAALLTLAPISAFAVPTAKDKEDAKAAIAEARVAIGINHFKEAIKAYKRADELDPNPQTKVDLADAYNSAGKLIEASQILNLVIDANPPAPKKLKESAQKMLESIEPRIPWIQIVVVGPEQKLTSTTIDGREIDAENEIPFNPGDHTVAADADGYNAVEKKVKLAEGAHQTVKLKMERSDGSHKKTKKAAEEAEEEGGGSSEEGSAEGEAPKPKSGGSITDSKFFLPAVISGGVGVAGLLSGTIAGAIALGTAADLDAKCKGKTVCAKTATTQGLQDDAILQGNVSTAMFIIGGLGAAAGGVFIFLAATSDSPKAAPKPKDDEAFVRPYIGVGRAGVYGQF